MGDRSALVLYEIVCGVRPRLREVDGEGPVHNQDTDVHRARNQKPVLPRTVDRSRHDLGKRGSRVCRETERQCRERGGSREETRATRGVRRIARAGTGPLDWEALGENERAHDVGHDQGDWRRRRRRRGYCSCAGCRHGHGRQCGCGRGRDS